MDSNPSPRCWSRWDFTFCSWSPSGATNTGDPKIHHPDCILCSTSSEPMLMFRQSPLPSYIHNKSHYSIRVPSISLIAICSANFVFIFKSWIIPSYQISNLIPDQGDPTCPQDASISTPSVSYSSIHRITSHDTIPRHWYRCTGNKNKSNSNRCLMIIIMTKPLNHMIFYIADLICV